MSSTYDAQIYDLVTPRDLSGDINWYRGLAVAAGGPVLELGAGTGRVTIELARAGIDIVGLDSNSQMLARLVAKVDSLEPDHRRRVATLQGDMQSFEAGRQFALVIAPFRVFLHNLTEQEQEACCARVFAHLRPGGKFALNVFHPSLTVMAQHVGHFKGVWRFNGEWPLDDGGFLLRSEANTYDTVRKLVHSRHRYERFDSSGALNTVFLQRLELAYMYPQDLTRLLDRAGFKDIRIFGGFDGRPFSSDLDELVVVAKRPLTL
jgi:SAM-dependent methyltransferase